MEKRKAIFFDRDGVVNYRIVDRYVQKPEQFKFINDFISFFKSMKDKGYLAILITNQQGIGKGLMTEQELAEVHNFMQNELMSITGYCFDDIYYCTDLASTGSYRRKPNPGMLLEAVEKWNIDKNESVMIGDRRSDAGAGKNAGVKTVLIGISAILSQYEADIIAANLFEVEGLMD